MIPDINTQLIDLPTAAHEVVVTNEDGSYTIIINARLSSEAQHKAYRHALRHIRSNDFEKDDVQQIEADAHDIP